MLLWIEIRPKIKKGSPPKRAAPKIKCYGVKQILNWFLSLPEHVGLPIGTNPAMPEPSSRSADSSEDVPSLSPPKLKRNLFTLMIVS
jgi:hypothetical protein